MTATQTLLARAALGVVTASAGCVAVFVDRFRHGTARTFDRWANTVFLISRFGLYGLLFVVMRLAPRGDIPAYYFPEANAVLRGALPYRDIASSYAPLHPYLDGIAILLWRSPLAIILLAILVEAFLLPVWLKLGRELFPEQSVRTAAILYIASPISLQFVAVDGQDNVIIALLLALGVYALLKHRAVVSGALIAIGAVCVKFLPLLYFPAFLLAARRRLSWMLGFVGVLAVGYGGFALMRLPLLSPLTRQGDLKTASNLTYVIESVLNVTIPARLGDGLLLFVFLLIFMLAYRAMRGATIQMRMKVLVYAMAALTLALLVFSKKSWPPYLMFALFPICLLLSHERPSRLRMAGFALFSMVAVVVQSFWATVFDLPLAPQFHAILLTHRPAGPVFLLLQLMIVAGYLWLFMDAFQKVSFVSRETKLSAALD
jgi:hypothetical protein